MNRRPVVIFLARSLRAACLLLFAGVLLAGAAPVAHAQELNCDVTVNYRQLQGTEYGFLDELEDDVERYLNSRSWTDDAYAVAERINCTMQIVFTTATGLTNYSAEIVVQASRPIYGTGQRTTTFLVNDDAWSFTYTRGQSLVYNPSGFDSFVSVLDFYALMILGYDYDTFSEMGGTPFFEEAFEIAQRGRSAPQSIGWGADAAERRSRFALVQDLLETGFAPLRRAMFTYHFEVLDGFVGDPDGAWDTTLEMLQRLSEFRQQYTQRRYAVDVFFTTKYEELTALLLQAPNRNQAYALLSEIDPVHLSTYDRLVSG